MIEKYEKLSELLNTIRGYGSSGRNDELKKEIEAALASEQKSASKTAKEIALNAALTVYTPHNGTTKDIVDAAQTIFEWLAK